MKLIGSAARIAVVAILSQSTLADAQGLLPSSPQLNLAAARKVANVAEQYAALKGWPCAVAVVDDGGWPMLIERMDGTPVVVAPELASAKARTASLFRRSTADLERAVNTGRAAAMTAGFNMMQGGRPLVVDGHVIGAVGISSDTPVHDDEIARAAQVALGQ